MPMSRTCKEAGKNHFLIYYPSLGYKRKNKTFVLGKSIISPLLSREEEFDGHYPQAR